MQIKKSTKLQSVKYDIRGPVAEEAVRMRQAGIDIIQLNTGNPAAFGFAPPAQLPNILEEKQQLTAAYSDAKGLPYVREAIAAYEKSKGIPNVHVDHIFTGNGVSELITTCTMALLNPGDEILIPMPDYPLWTAASRLAGGTVVHYTCDEAASWFPDLADMRRKITPRTKAIVVISPNNPTGALYPREILQGICEMAREHNLLIFSDEIYDRMLMDGNQHTAVASLAPDLCVITFNGLSKSHQLCGYRSGWMTISGDVSGAADYLEGLTVLASMRLCSNVPAQAIIPDAMQNPNFSEAELLPGGRLYEQRQQAFDGLQSIPGISVVKSMAGLYLFPKMDVALGVKDDEQFALDFLRQKYVLVTPGSGFNWPTPDHFRLVYLPEKEVLAEVIDRLRDFLATYRQGA